MVNCFEYFQTKQALEVFKKGFIFNAKKSRKFRDFLFIRDLY